MTDTSETPASPPVLAFVDDAGWEAWLESAHATTDAIWLRLSKKGSNTASVSVTAAIRTALCWGWIDGQTRSADADSYLTRFTPRRRRSQWSQVNVRHVEELTATGRMRPAGLAQVESAKADGRWQAAYPPASSRHVPPELQVALDRSPEARAAFAALPAVERFAITYRIQSVRRPETKQRHVDAFLAVQAPPHW